MKNNYTYLILLLLTALTYAQTGQSGGVGYQVVIYKPNVQGFPGVPTASTPLSNAAVCLQFTFFSNGQQEYVERREVVTDAFGMINLKIGDALQEGGNGTFGNISWSDMSKSLLVELDASGSCTNFEEISNESLAAAPFAFNSITSNNVSGIVAIANGGTGATSDTGALANLGAESIVNMSQDILLDREKVDMYPSVNALVDYIEGSVVVLRAPIASPSFTGTPSAATAAAATSTTQLATTEFVTRAVASSTIASATTISEGKIQLAGDLAGTAALPTVPGLVLKVDKVAGERLINASEIATLSNQSNRNTGDQDLSSYATQSALDLKSNTASPSFTGVPTAPTATATDNGTTLATTAFVSTAVSDATIFSATTISEGKIQLAGDLSGTAALPEIGVGKITSGKILDGTILSTDLSDGAIDLASSKVGGVLSISKGGTGSVSLTGFVKGNGTAGFSTVSQIPVADVNGAVQKVNGSLPDANGNVTVSFAAVATGVLSSRPATAANGTMYVVSKDSAVNNGRTFISDGSSWAEITSDQAATDSRYVKLSGSTMAGVLTFPTGTNVVVIDAPRSSTDVTNKKYVDDSILAGTTDATVSAKGKIQLAGDLSGTAAAPTVPGLALKAPLVSPVFTGTVTGVSAAMVGLGNVDNTTDLSKPLSTATKIYVDNQIVNGAIADASTSTKGKIQLAGDLSGTAALPEIGVGKITSGKILDGTILSTDLSDGAIDLASSKVGGVLSTSKGGTGSVSLTGFVKGNGTAGFSTVSQIPVADVNGAVQKVNGSLPDANGNVTVSFAAVATGVLSSRPATAANGAMYVVSTDSAVNNGRTFISDGSSWAEITSDQAAMDSRYVKLSGSTMAGVLTFPAGTNAVVIDAPRSSTDVTNKKYVDDSILAGTTDATVSAKGKIQLAGDLSGTAAAPTVPGLALKAPLVSPVFTGTVTGVSAAMVGLGNVDNTTDLSKPISTATRIYVDNQIVNGAIADATTISEGKIQLAGDLSGTAALPTVPGLVLKVDKVAGERLINASEIANLSNQSNRNTGDQDLSSYATQSALGLKANSASPSFTGVPTAPTAAATDNGTTVATTAFVSTAVAAATISSATTISEGKIQLAGDLSGTAALPTVPGLAFKENAENKSINIKGDPDSDVKYPSVKAVKKYVDEVAATGLKENIINYIATDGQVQFKTLVPIVDGKTVGLYRNGIRVSVTIVDSNTIQLEAGVICYANDEIKVVQFY